MPLRLGISITSLRRVFGDAAVTPDDDGFLILTQDGNAILSQRGEFFVTQDAPVSADFLETGGRSINSGRRLHCSKPKSITDLIIESRCGNQW